MRAMFLIACIAAAQVNAKEVEATGLGATFEEALNSAKTVAVEQVAGTFLVAEATLAGDALTSRLEQYNGGLIRSYQVLTTGQRDGLIEVAIRADVDVDKANSNIVSSGAAISPEIVEQLQLAQEERRKAAAILRSFDDPAKAFAVEITRVRYHDLGEMTDVVVEAQVMLSPKWYDDMRVLARTISRDVEIGGGPSGLLYLLGALSAAVNPALPGILFTAAGQAERSADKPADYMACFFTGALGWNAKPCYEIRQPLPKIARTRRVVVAVQLASDFEQRHVQDVDVFVGRALAREVAAGETIYFERYGDEQRFRNPGVILFGKAATPFSVVFPIKTDSLRTMSRVELTIRSAAS